jgi:hypothetical protein
VRIPFFFAWLFCEQPNDTARRFRPHLSTYPLPVLVQQSQQFYDLDQAHRREKSKRADWQRSVYIDASARSEKRHLGRWCAHLGQRQCAHQAPLSCAHPARQRVAPLPARLRSSAASAKPKGKPFTSASVYAPIQRWGVLSQAGGNAASAVPGLHAGALPVQEVSSEGSVRCRRNQTSTARRIKSFGVS